MSYLSSPLWLVMIGIGFALAIQSHLIRPEYFSHDFQLFPTWPRFDVELMMALFWFSMLVLLIPKMLGLIRALLSRRIRRGGGGVIGITASFVLEVILSALYAPILMIDAEPACLRSVHGARLGLEDAAPRRRRHHLVRRLALSQAAHAPELRDRRDRLVSSRRRCWHGCRRRCSGCFWRCRCRAPAAARPWADSCRAWRCCARRKRSRSPALVARRERTGAPGGRGCRPTDCAIWRAIARRGSRTSAAIWRAPRIRAASRIRTPSRRNRKLKDARSLGRGLAMADADRTRRGRGASRASSINSPCCPTPLRPRSRSKEIRLHGSSTRNLENCQWRSPRFSPPGRPMAAPQPGRNPPRPPAPARPRPSTTPGSRARRDSLAGSAYQPSRTRCRPAWRSSSYDQYQSLRFRTDHALWGNAGLPFRLQFFHVGRGFAEPVHLYEIIDGSRARSSTTRRCSSSTRPASIRLVMRDHAGFAGFRVQFVTDWKDDVAAFLGASLFSRGGRRYAPVRTVGARTGRGHRIPAARGVSALHLILVRAAGEGVGHADHVRADGFAQHLPARCASRSPPAARRPWISIGALYPRKPIERLGMAPLTSMFFYGENDHRDRERLAPGDSRLRWLVDVDRRAASGSGGR